MFDKGSCVLHTDYQSNHVVYEARFGRRHVALKEYRTDARSLSRFYKEALVLRRLRHPGIVEIEAIFACDSNLYLQMPFYEHGTLRQWVQSQQPDATALATVLQKILEALTHLHTHRVYHLDLKPENILLDAASRPHIADYDISHDGATRAIQRRQTHVTRMGTDGFVAPELDAGCASAQASAAADMFSLGKTIEAVVPDEDLRRTAQLTDLLKQLIQVDPVSRPSAAQATQHPYFAPLLSGRFEGSRTCVICLEVQTLSDGVCCTPALPEETEHFTCRSCLDEHVRRAALLQLPPTADDEDDEAERARMLRQRLERQGRICCPQHPRECRAAPFGDDALARALPPHTFTAYMESRQQLTEERLEREKEQRMQELLQAELTRLRAMDERSREVRGHTNEVSELLTTKCPRCDAAFVDFTGCCALQCASCPAYFCAWCLKLSADSGSNHSHVANCREKPAGANMYYPNDLYAAYLKRRRTRLVQEALARLDPELAGDVYDVLHPQIADLNIERPGQPVEVNGDALLHNQERRLMREPVQNRRPEH